MISADDRVPRQLVRVLGRRLSVATAGEGRNVVFLHGNGTYSYAWRNLIPFLANGHRCIAPDLLGMGRSDAVFPSGASSYSFQDQFTHLDLLIQELTDPGPVVLVGHELGALLAIHYARRHLESVTALILIEGVFRVSNDDLFDRDVRRFLQEARSESGDDMVLRDNVIIERWLPRHAARTLTPIEMDAYREPYRRPGESRRALLSMIRQLPLRSSPGPIDYIAEEARLWCAQAAVPKLVVGGDPGFLVPASILGTAARWRQTTVAKLPGRHLLMEDSPARLTSLIIDWLATLARSPA